MRYVHGVGVVPILSMPFADKVFEANARVTCRVVKGLFEIETKRSFPEVGEEASMGSCGGSEWNERTRYAEDRKYFLSSGGAFEALRTVDEKKKSHTYARVRAHILHTHREREREKVICGHISYIIY